MRLLAPAGAGGAAFLLSGNFDAIKSYNNSDSYALSVALLGDQIAGRGTLPTRWPTANPPLGRAAALELQSLLLAMGYQVGTPDGQVGRTVPVFDGQRVGQAVSPDEGNIRGSDRIGIMGFSAGGHLASTAGTHFENVVIPNEKKTSVRPDFMILIYPVISFQMSFAHVGSRDQLIGKQPQPSARKKDHAS